MINTKDILTLNLLYLRAKTIKNLLCYNVKINYLTTCTEYLFRNESHPPWHRHLESFGRTIAIHTVLTHRPGGWCGGSRGARGVMHGQGDSEGYLEAGGRAGLGARHLRGMGGRLRARPGSHCRRKPRIDPCARRPARPHVRARLRQHR